MTVLLWQQHTHGSSKVNAGHLEPALSQSTLFSQFDCYTQKLALIWYLLNVNVLYLHQWYLHVYAVQKRPTLVIAFNMQRFLSDGLPTLVHLDLCNC